MKEINKGKLLTDLVKNIRIGEQGPIAKPAPNPPKVTLS